MRIHPLALTALAALAGAGVLSGDSRAQDYPAKPLRLIVPFPPGGGNDILARAVGQRFAEAIVQRLNGELVKTLRTPAMIESLGTQGLEAAGGAPERFGIFIKS